MTTLHQLGRWWRSARAREATAATALLLVIAFGAPRAQRMLLGPDTLTTAEACSPRAAARRSAPVSVPLVVAAVAVTDATAVAPWRRLSVIDHSLPAPRAPDHR